ncbi:hypothetical protein MRB53_038045 [Persea americana]|nr:hypothetical protein MRB53_038045 [Persea americana]
MFRAPRERSCATCISKGSGKSSAVCHNQAVLLSDAGVGGGPASSQCAVACPPWGVHACRPDQPGGCEGERDARGHAGVGVKRPIRAPGKRASPADTPRRSAVPASVRTTARTRAWVATSGVALLPCLVLERADVLLLQVQATVFLTVLGGPNPLPLPTVLLPRSTRRSARTSPTRFQRLHGHSAPTPPPDAVMFWPPGCVISDHDVESASRSVGL